MNYWQEGNHQQPPDRGPAQPLARRLGRLALCAVILVLLFGFCAAMWLPIF